ncbi:MAG: hypothetical protein MRECE_4c063 [Mycoplasmataceae bacterium CE_OT135]|nr:MAG: hypothetical protein MRECE_4c063 [Mycoplasmataceae bacterium CE_OT135]
MNLLNFYLKSSKDKNDAGIKKKINYSPLPQKEKCILNSLP